MAWQYPASTSTADTVALDLGTTDSAFIDEDVLIFSQSNYAILGTGDNHVVEVSGEVRSGFVGIGMGVPDAQETTGNAVFVDLGGKVDATGDNAVGVAFYGNGNLLVNDGEINGVFAGVYFKSDVMVANRFVNHGTIIGEYGVAGRQGIGETILRNSGRIEGTTASYGYQGNDPLDQTVDIIHNNGVMIGSAFLLENDDKYFGAKGQLTGTISGGRGNDELYAGAGSQYLDGGEGNDTIAGGSGADRISGGPGEDSSSTDTVIYYRTSDSTLKHFDVLTDISTSHGLDTVDLRLIDANTKKAGNQAFHFSDHQEIGGLWDKVVYPHSGHVYMMLYGETDGDKQADFCIKWLNHDSVNPIEILF